MEEERKRMKARSRAKGRRTSGAEHLMGLGFFSSAQRYSYLGPALMTEQAEGVQNSVMEP